MNWENANPDLHTRLDNPKPLPILNPDLQALVQSRLGLIGREVQLKDAHVRDGQIPGVSLHYHHHSPRKPARRQPAEPGDLRKKGSEERLNHHTHGSAGAGTLTQDTSRMRFSGVASSK